MCDETCRAKLRADSIAPHVTPELRQKDLGFPADAFILCTIVFLSTVSSHLAFFFFQKKLHKHINISHYWSSRLYGPPPVLGWLGYPSVKGITSEDPPYLQSVPEASWIPIPCRACSTHSSNRWSPSGKSPRSVGVGVPQKAQHDVLVVKYLFNLLLNFYISTIRIHSLHRL